MLAAVLLLGLGVTAPAGQPVLVAQAQPAPVLPPEDGVMDPQPAPPPAQDYPQVPPPSDVEPAPQPAPQPAPGPTDGLTVDDLEDDEEDEATPRRKGKKSKDSARKKKTRKDREEDDSGVQAGPGPVLTALAAGGAACGAMGGTWCAHALLAIPMSLLALCPIIGIPWNCYLLFGMPLVVAEVGALTGQAVAGKYGRRRVANLLVWAGTAPVMCGGIACTNLVGAVFGISFYAVVLILSGTNQDLANIVGCGLLSFGLVVNALMLVATMGAAASMVGALAAYTGRPLFEGEHDLNWDMTSVPADPDLEDEDDD